MCYNTSMNISTIVQPAPEHINVKIHEEALPMYHRSQEGHLFHRRISWPRIASLLKQLVWE